jgi:hypothetical protein
LHANIDIGGYAWATMEFGWNIEKMRRPNEKNASPAQIIQEFAQERLELVKDLLSSSAIPLETPAIASLLQKLEATLNESPLAITPHHTKNTHQTPRNITTHTTTKKNIKPNVSFRKSFYQIFF